MSTVPEELSIRELLVSLLGEKGRRILENRTKSNDQLFSEYLELISTTHVTTSYYEAKRLLMHFKNSLGEFPPSTELGVKFLSQFKDRKATTRGRYLHTLNAFFRWYNGENLPLKIREPKYLPQYVLRDDINCVISTMRSKRGHKDTIERDVLLVETAIMTGLRRGELANLKIGDLHLAADIPLLIVRLGKGAKDRSVDLNSYIKDRLAGFIKGKAPEESLFGLAPKSISLKFRYWATKAGKPHLHFHSLRHYVGTTLFERGADPRKVQVILGHESLETTMRYAAVTGQGLKETVDLLQDQPEKPVSYEPTDDVMPVSYSKEVKKKRKEKNG